jgi:NAD+ kinase
MRTMMDNYLIFTNQSKDKNLEVTNKVKAFLEQHGKHATVARFEEPSDDVDRPDAVSFRTQVPPETDCCIVLGGDGTVLQAAGNVRDMGIPLLGINLGTLGYLAEIDTNRIPDALERLIDGDYLIENRMLLSGRTLFGNYLDFEALNDIVIARTAAMQVISLRVFVNGKYLTTYTGDGVIISTPTGSTGYNMSAGGPLVEPGATTILLTPICPHTLNSRSIVLSGNARIEIELGAGKVGRKQDAEASIDGRFGTSMVTGDRIEITKSERTTRIIRLTQVSFLEILNRKLN